MLFIDDCCLPRAKMPMRVWGHLTPRSQQEGTEEHEININVPQQEGQADATGNPDIDYEPEGSDLKLKQSVKKRKTLMQNM